VTTLVVAGLVWQRDLPPPPISNHAPALSKVDPTVAGVIRSLQTGRIPCIGFRVVGPHAASCRLGAMTRPVTVTSYPTHPAAVAALAALERSARGTFASKRQVTFLIAGSAWVITGVWSDTGAYETATQLIDPTVAQQASVVLKGCLELLPREAGSCSF